MGLGIFAGGCSILRTYYASLAAEGGGRTNITCELYKPPDPRKLLIIIRPNGFLDGVGFRRDVVCLDRLQRGPGLALIQAFCPAFIHYTIAQGKSWARGSATRTRFLRRP